MAKFNYSFLSVSILTALTRAAIAQEKPTTQLEPIIVSTARDSSPLAKLANNATVIRTEKLDKNLQNNVEDALNDVPGVSFDSNGRFGLQDVTIRGISGNRVKILVDGQPIANEFSFGPFQSAGRQYIDLNNVDQLEIIKGPTSSLHGSDAIGGVVNLVSKTPSAYLKNGQALGGTVFSKYSGKDRSIINGATVTFAPHEQVDGLVSVVSEHGKETKNFGDGNKAIGAKRTAPNPSKDKSNSIQTQLRYKPNESNTFTLAGSYYRLNNDANILTSYGRMANYIYSNYRSEDVQKRSSVSIRHDFVLNNPVVDSGFWKIYGQHQKSTQKTLMSGKYVQDKTEHNMSRLRNNFYKVKETGFEAQFNKRIGDTVSHNLMYGVSLENKKVNMLQTGFDDLTVRKIPTKGKNAPDSTIRQMGAFLQDRVQLADSGVTLIGGARYDHYHLKTHPDADFYAAAGKDFKVKNISEGELSLRLGALYDLNQNNTLFFNYAEGFRVPDFSETNLGFSNHQQGYSYVANPNLKSEKSHGFEIGWRGDNGFIQHDLSAFYTKYNNFIETNQSVGKNPKTNLIEFTSVNLPRTYIYGAEFTLRADFEAINPNLAGLSIDLSIAYAHGKDKKSGEPLVSISPFSGHLGVNYDKDIWGVGAKLNFAKGKSASDIPASLRNPPKNSRIPPALPTAGYGTLDFTAYYKPLNNLTVRAGAFNALDKKYITWSNAKNASELDRERLTATGRWFGASVKYDF